MNSDQSLVQNTMANDVYIKIWQAEQDFSRTRWTIMTFFIGLSFAVLAYSFQKNFDPSESLAIRLVALFIYWFSYILYVQHYTHNRMLRKYLIDMEQSKQTTLNLQSFLLEPTPNNKPYRLSHMLLLYFGAIYTLGLFLFWFFRV